MAVAPGGFEPGSYDDKIVLEAVIFGDDGDNGGSVSGNRRNGQKARARETGDELAGKLGPSLTEYAPEGENQFIQEF